MKFEIIERNDGRRGVRIISSDNGKGMRVPDVFVKGKIRIVPQSIFILEQGGLEQGGVKRIFLKKLKELAQNPKRKKRAIFAK